MISGSGTAYHNVKCTCWRMLLDGHACQSDGSWRVSQLAHCSTSSFADCFSFKKQAWMEIEFLFITKYQNFEFQIRWNKFLLQRIYFYFTNKFYKYFTNKFYKFILCDFFNWFENQSYFHWKLSILNIYDETDIYWKKRYLLIFS